MRLESTPGEQGFIKQLFLGHLDQSKIFPFPRVSLEEKEKIDLFCHKLRQFCETAIDPVAIDEKSYIPEEVIQGLGKLGMLGLTIPVEYGGLGFGLTGYCKAIEILSQRCSSTAAFVTAHQSIGFKAILLYGTAEQKQKWLPPIAKGEYIASFALTEENAGSDANGVETKAEYDPEKNVFYLTGRKQWITNGAFAKILTVMAKVEVDGPKGKKSEMTAFIVTPDMPGFSVVTPNLDKVGIRGIQNATLEFNRMEVPAENLLGKLGEGLRIALSVLNYGRVTIGAGCTGTAKILTDQALKHAHDRKQFSKPLSDFELVKEKISLLAALTYAMDAVTYLTAGRVDSNEKDFMLEAALVKVFATESLWHMIFETMQIFGGRSMFTEKPYGLMMRDCRPSMVVEGSNDVMRLFVALKGFKDASKDFENFSILFQDYDHFNKRWIYFKNLMFNQTLEIYSPLLKTQTKQVSVLVKRLGRAVLKCAIKYRGEVADRQLDLNRLAKVAMYIYTMSAVISKLDSDLEKSHENLHLLGNDVDIVKYYCAFAYSKSNQLIRQLFSKNDQLVKTLSEQLIEDH
jgi:alkylation response protein AidB-like acyl-CoA dehydrogenase